jgi:hypothetical protein
MAFFIPAILALELIFSGHLLASGFRKRELFWLKFIGYSFSVILLVLFTELCFVFLGENDFIYGESQGPEPLNDSIFYFLFYCSIFVATAIMLRSCFDARKSEILSAVSVAYTIQHICRQFSTLISLTGVFDTLANPLIIEELIQVTLTIVASLICYFNFIRNKENLEIYRDTGSIRVAISIAVILLCIGMSRIAHWVPNRSPITIFTECIYSILCGMFVIFMQFGIVVLERTRRKADYLSEVLALERKQYKISKETIDLINIKCHDIKHQLNEFRKNIDEESYKELERSASIYESIYHTGLEALDIVLTEKTFQCESKQIQMNCFADGKLISFMEENDVYSLFGNALSNAIESLEGVAEEKRYISVRISRHKDLAIIHIENYFDGELSFKDSLPVTKRDTKFHGYGVKSMERIALKYGGEMSVMTENNVFNLDIVIPIPETKKA